MEIVFIIIHKYSISFIFRMNTCYIQIFLCIYYIDSNLITCMVNYFYWIVMRLNLFASIVLVYSFIVDTNTLLFINFFLINECIKWTSVFNVAVRKVWSSYNIITVWCIQIILFISVDMGGIGITYPLFKLGKTFLLGFLLDDVYPISIIFLL